MITEVDDLASSSDGAEYYPIAATAVALVGALCDCLGVSRPMRGAINADDLEALLYRPRSKSSSKGGGRSGGNGGGRDALGRVLALPASSASVLSLNILTTNPFRKSVPGKGTSGDIVGDNVVDEHSEETNNDEGYNKGNKDEEGDENDAITTTRRNVGPNGVEGFARVCAFCLLDFHATFVDGKHTYMESQEVLAEVVRRIEGLGETTLDDALRIEVSGGLARYYAGISDLHRSLLIIDSDGGSVPDDVPMVQGQDAVELEVLGEVDAIFTLKSDAVIAGAAVRAKALFDYTTEHDDELSFRVGGVITLIECEEGEDWWRGSLSKMDTGTEASGGCSRQIMLRNGRTKINSSDTGYRLE